jgi:beta-lactamase class A
LQWLLALAVGCASLGSASAQTAAAVDLRTAGDPVLQRSLESTVRALGLDAAIQAGRLALALVDVSEGARPRLAMLNGDRMMYAASLPKIAILVGAVAEAGRLRLDDERLAAMANTIRRSGNGDATRVLN